MSTDNIIEIAGIIISVILGVIGVKCIKNKNSVKVSGENSGNIINGDGNNVKIGQEVKTSKEKPLKQNEGDIWYEIIETEDTKEE